MTAIAFLGVAALATIVRAVLTAAPPKTAIPWRTLAVNVGGAFALGLASTSGWIENPIIYSTAALGSLTTFSTVASETSTLISHNRRGIAIAYVATSLVLGIAAAWLGVVFGEAG